MNLEHVVRRDVRDFLGGIPVHFERDLRAGGYATDLDERAQLVKQAEDDCSAVAKRWTDRIGTVDDRLTEGIRAMEAERESRATPYPRRRVPA